MYLSEAHWVTHTHTHTQTNDIILCTKQGTDTKLVECPPLLQRIQLIFVPSAIKLMSFIWPSKSRLTFSFLSLNFYLVSVLALSLSLFSTISLWLSSFLGENTQNYEGVTVSFRTESITKYTLTTINTRWEAIQRVMAEKLTRLTHKIAIQLQLVAESCIVCSSRSRRQVRKRLDTSTCT
jgi:hypothetical protein